MKWNKAANVREYITLALKEQLLAPLHSDRPPIERIRGMNQNVDAFYQHGQQDCLLALLSVGDALSYFIRGITAPRVNCKLASVDHIYCLQNMFSKVSI